VFKLQTGTRPSHAVRSQYYQYELEGVYGADDGHDTDIVGLRGTPGRARALKQSIKFFDFLDRKSRGSPA
jgi:hypothetical protein